MKKTLLILRWFALASLLLVGLRCTKNIPTETQQNLKKVTSLTEKPFTWDNAFWDTLQKDSLFMQLGSLFEIEIIEAEWDSLKPNAQEDYLAQLDFIHRLATDIMLETTEITLALYARYPDDYSYHYPQKLLKLKKPELNRISTRMGDDAVVTDCRRAISTYNDMTLFYSLIYECGDKLALDLCGKRNSFNIMRDVLYAQSYVFGRLSGYAWNEIERKYYYADCVTAISFSYHVLEYCNVYMSDVSNAVVNSYVKCLSDPIRFFDPEFMRHGIDLGACIANAQGGGVPGGGGNPDPPTPPSSQRAPQQITSTAQDVASSIPGLDPQCSEGVRRAFKQLFNSNELVGMNANSMIRHMNGSGHWQATSLSEAQGLANQGYFVVAGWDSGRDSEYGHVAVVVPGTMEYSGAWRCNLPMVMDTGRNRRESSIKLSYGFGSGKRNSTVFYYYK